MYGELPAGMDVQMGIKDLVTVLADTVRKAERGGKGIANYELGITNSVIMI
jgi:hypothetical protein